MSNKRIQETRAKCNISEYFAELLSCFRGGMIQIGMANQSVLKIRAENSQIVLNLFTSKSIVDVNDKRNNENAAKLSLRKKISEAKDFAKYLRNNDLTISMRYEDKEIIVLGEKAKPKFSKLIIGSDIQIKNLRQLARLDNELFNA
ncbi:MAG: hypothetical protein WBL67_15395 [Nitrososphaeraceae archaeon]